MAGNQLLLDFSAKTLHENGVGPDHLNLDALLHQ
jgi:hypothetical protein